MTYEQLLEKVSVNALVPPNALRAVVELHKPEFWISLNTTYCESCQDQIYPCVTIMAIEKEIK